MKLPRWLARMPIPLYRAGLGRLFGHRFIMIEHVGRRSGQTRYVVVEVVRWEAETRRAVVVSGLGPTAQWYRNVEAEPHVRVNIAGDRHVAATAHLLSPEESAVELRSYRERHPVAMRELSRLVDVDLSGEIDASVGARVPGVVFELAPAV